MKRQKLLKVAGGALAAAMSLAMLAGCQRQYHLRQFFHR